MNICYNMDCAELLCMLPDAKKNKRTVLAIVDPPYGINFPNDNKKQKILKKYYQRSKSADGKDWDKMTPGKNYFDKIFKISKYQMIFGCNYFIEYLKNTNHAIIYDKVQRGPFFNHAEIIWTNFGGIKTFSCHPTTRIKQDGDNIHPCQKPVAFYRWALTNYAKPDWLILDTHVGSGSIRIACHDLGFDFIGTENDTDYWQAQEERFWNHIAQPELMKNEIQKIIYEQEELCL